MIFIRGRGYSEDFLTEFSYVLPLPPIHMFVLHFMFLHLFGLMLLSCVSSLSSSWAIVRTNAMFLNKTEKASGSRNNSLCLDFS